MNLTSTEPARGRAAQLPPGAKRLYGALSQEGVCLCCHQSDGSGSVTWPKESSETLLLILNLEGGGTFAPANARLEFQPRTGAFVFTAKGDMSWLPQSGLPQQWITVEFSSKYLRRHLQPCDGALHKHVEAFLGGTAPVRFHSRLFRMSNDQERAVRRLAQPQVMQGGRSLWYQGQLLQLMAEFFFERTGADELFCDRQKRLGRERAGKVIAILQRELQNPPTLEAIGKEVGCSPFHLSRSFSTSMGMTIPQYLRKLRMERAAELLREGKLNVTEAALEVGYSSLSHFSQAFCQTMGCCPGLYPFKPQGTANK